MNTLFDMPSAIPEPPVMLAGMNIPRYERKWNSGADWRWLFRRGRGNDVSMKNHAKPKESTPLLAILALRRQGYGVKQIVKRLGSNVHTVCASVEQYGVKPAGEIIEVGQCKGWLWAGWLEHEIEAHGRVERLHAEWWKRAYAKKLDVNTYAREYYHRVIKKDPNKYLRLHVRWTVRRCVNRGAQSVAAFEQVVGCSMAAYRNYLSERFRDGMNWDNFGKVWEIDHIKLLCRFDLKDDEQLRVAAHYTNTQPLLVKENRSKSGKYADAA